MSNPYPGDDEYRSAEWPYSRPYDALVEYERGKEAIHGRRVASDPHPQRAQQAVCSGLLSELNTKGA